MKLNPMLKIDYYKMAHPSQYPDGITKLVSYLTPRMSRIPGQDKLILFGLQAFLREYLIEDFRENFFKKTKSEVISEYKRIADHTFGEFAYDLSKICRLHDLGYLPIEIRALPEGSRVNMHVPMIEISNTHPDFAWLVGTLETMLSSSLWHTMVSANVGYMYRQIVNEFYDRTVDNSIPRARALGDFSMRGQESVESAIKSSAAFCLSFLNTATVPAIPWLERYYNCDCSTEPVAFGAISTEHSVMCSNFAVDGDEITMLRRLLNDIYPDQSFSVVSDSYDYWNLVNNILPQLKDEILSHNGCMLIRGDSGDPVAVVTQTVFRLWEIFGGSLNSKGFKVLDPHVKAIYGDSITPQRCRAIFEILEANGFACNNVSLGVGSFSMQCLEHYDGNGVRHFNPYTRDTFGIAVKATYAEDESGKPVFIFKNPKTDSGHFKKSQKGCCSVHYDGKDFSYVDELTANQRDADAENQLVPVFHNGSIVNSCTLNEVRSRLHGGQF